jgi:hypothetical protein
MWALRDLDPPTGTSIGRMAASGCATGTRAVEPPAEPRRLKRAVVVADVAPLNTVTM